MYGACVDAKYSLFLIILHERARIIKLHTYAILMMTLLYMFIIPSESCISLKNIYNTITSSLDKLPSA